MFETITIYLLLGIITTAILTSIESEIKYVWQLLVTCIFWPICIIILICEIRFRK
jgi:cell shape-determining protein MreD